MDSINKFFNELDTCNLVIDLNGSYFYNGFSLEVSSEAFQKKLYSLYNSARSEVMFLSNEMRDCLSDKIEECKENQSLFVVPDEAYLNSMNVDIEAGNDNPNLRRERDYVKIVCECVSLQKYYLDKFAAALGCTQKQQLQVEISPIGVKDEDLRVDENVLKGVAGLAGFLGCGINSAQGIINSKILEEKKIQYKIGKAWRFNKNKLASLLEANPEIFKKLPKE